MNTMKFKTICNVNAAQVFPQSPNANLGTVGSIRTIEITDIPDSVTAAQVLKAWKETSDISWLYSEDGHYTRNSYKFDEIGNGRILGMVRA